jgi:hypothetical protein
VRLVVWNSQGGKWNDLWSNWIVPYAYPVNPANREDVIGLVVEAGWAPWVTPGPVRLNGEYFLDESMTWYDPVAAGRSIFCQAMLLARTYKAMWIPWVGNPEAFKTNTRCSMAAVVCPRSFRIGKPYRLDLTAQGHWRPVVCIPVGIGDMPLLTIYCVHLISGYAPNALAELNSLTGQIGQRIPQGTIAVVVGDMNIPGPIQPGQGWVALDANPPGGTQKSGNDLDWALLWDPNRFFVTRTATELQHWKTPPNNSDHSVMSYVLRA